MCPSIDKWDSCKYKLMGVGRTLLRSKPLSIALSTPLHASHHSMYTSLAHEGMNRYGSHSPRLAKHFKFGPLRSEFRIGPRPCRFAHDGGRRLFRLSAVTRTETALGARLGSGPDRVASRTEAGDRSKTETASRRQCPLATD